MDGTLIAPLETVGCAWSASVECCAVAGLKLRLVSGATLRLLALAARARMESRTRLEAVKSIHDAADEMCFDALVVLLFHLVWSSFELCFSLVERIEKFVAANPWVCPERLPAIDVARCYIWQQLMISLAHPSPLSSIMIASEVLWVLSYFNFSLFSLCPADKRKITNRG